MAYMNMTREGEKKIHEELRFLKEERRPEIIKSLQEARRKGDLSENGEYDAAKEAKAFVDTRIGELEKMLRSIRIIDDLDIDESKVYIGANVVLVDQNSGKEISYTLVNEVEADFQAKKISTTSPIGKALLGKSVDDTVEITVPKGTLKYKVIKISR